MLHGGRESSFFIFKSGAKIQNSQEFQPKTPKIFNRRLLFSSSNLELLKQRTPSLTNSWATFMRDYIGRIKVPVTSILFHSAARKYSTAFESKLRVNICSFLLLQFCISRASTSITSLSSFRLQSANSLTFSSK